MQRFVTIKQRQPVPPSTHPDIYHGILLEKYDKYCRVGIVYEGKAVIWECYYDYWIIE